MPSFAWRCLFHFNIFVRVFSPLCLLFYFQIFFLFHLLRVFIRGKDKKNFSRTRSFLFWIKEIGEEFQNPFHLFHDTIRRVAAYIKEDAR